MLLNFVQIIKQALYLLCSGMHIKWLTQKLNEQWADTSSKKKKKTAAQKVIITKIMSLDVLSKANETSETNSNFVHIQYLYSGNLLIPKVEHCWTVMMWLVNSKT